MAGSACRYVRPYRRPALRYAIFERVSVLIWVPDRRKPLIQAIFGANSTDYASAYTQSSPPSRSKASTVAKAHRLYLPTRIGINFSSLDNR